MSEAIRRFLRPLARHVTVLIIPHTDLPMWRARFTLNFILFLGLVWSGVTVWAGYLAGRHVDYWVTKADNQVMRSKLSYLASEMQKSKQDIDRALETDKQMRVLLGMRSRQSIVEGDEAVGGPDAADRLGLISRIVRDPAGATAMDIRGSLAAIRKQSNERLAAFQEIAWYIAHKRSLFRFTPRGFPAEGRVTSPFGYRFSPISRGDDAESSEHHSGLDIANSADTPILATADGVVRHAGWSGGYGRMVLIDHDWGYATLYGHTSKVLVAPGAVVRRGQMIAYMGTTGRSTGNHLHYEIWVHGKPVNPTRFLRPRPEDPAAGR